MLRWFWTQRWTWFPWIVFQYFIQHSSSYFLVLFWVVNKNDFWCSCQIYVSYEVTFHSFFEKWWPTCYPVHCVGWKGIFLTRRASLSLKSGIRRLLDTFDKRRDYLSRHIFPFLLLIWNSVARVWAMSPHLDIFRCYLRSWRIESS